MTAATELGSTEYAATAYDRILDRLGEGVRRRGDNSAMARCPAHDDRDPSLSVTRSRDLALVNCWAGCETSDVMAALDLTMSDLFDNRRDATWPYADGRTERKYYVNGRKRFAQPGTNNAATVLYTMAEPSEQLRTIREAVAAGETILLCEGAKDVDAVMSRWPGTVAVSAPQGAGSFHLVDASPLRGAEVIAVADRDEAGGKWAGQAIAKLEGVAKSLDFVQARRGKDAADHVNGGHTLAELVPWCPPEPEPASPGDPDQPLSVLSIGEPIDWHELWADDEPDEDWLVEPLIAAGRLVSVYSAPKVGKSLLMLELAAGLNAGRGVLGQPARDPVRVLYVDFENDPRGDIRQRLKAMDYGPDDLADLTYYSFPTLAALDSRQGGLELLATTRRERADLVVIDTVSRAVNGEENSNDTWLQFYRETGLRLKRDGIACVRLDHAGKDLTRGQRGGSAKSGDVDAVWNLTKIGADLFSLRCEASRQALPVDTLTLARRAGPLRHVPSGFDDEVAPAAAGRLAECMAWLDELDLPLQAGRQRCRTALEVEGHKVSNGILEEAIRRRRQPATRPSAEMRDTPIEPARDPLGQVDSDQLPGAGSGSFRAGETE